MKSLKILFIVFFLLYSLQNNAQEVYKPIDSVPALNGYGKLYCAKAF